jgi:hypothetical protein
MTSAYPGLAYPGATYPSDTGPTVPDRRPSRNLRLEVAFTTAPEEEPPVWVDVSSRLDLRAGITIRRGRGDEYETVQTGTMTLTLDNRDGALTPDNPSSPYYPNVIPQKRIRLSYVHPTSGAVNYRFDGFVDEWPVQWPGGSGNYSDSTITATDLLARIGTRQKLHSVIAETILLDNPSAYYPLSEPEGSTLVYDQSGAVGGTSLGLKQYGTGGAVTFAAGTGPATDGASAPMFAPASSSNGVYISGKTAPLFGSAGEITLEAGFATTTITQQTIAQISDDWGNLLRLELDPTGHVSALYWPASLPYTATAEVVASATYTGGSTHLAAARLYYNAGVVTLSLTVDTTLIGTATSTTSWTPRFSNLDIGGRLDGFIFTGTLSHVAVTPSKLSDARLLDHRAAQRDGFAGERSDQRIARIAAWANIPSSRLALDVGNATNIGHVDSTGLSPLDYMRKVEDTEGGLLFANMLGQLTLYNRARFYTPTSPAVTVPSRLLAGDVRYVKNLQDVRNEVTGSRTDGATKTARDPASITAYGLLSESLDLVTRSDAEVTDAVNWRLSTSSQPKTRITDLGLDAYTDATYSPLILSGFGIGARVTVTGMPTQAPATTLDQMVQGYTETISDTEWSFSANTSPYAGSVGLVLDDATYGTTDSTNLIAY